MLWSFVLLRLLSILLFNLDSLHEGLNSHYKAWNYKKEKHKKIKANRKWLVHFCYWCENGWVCFWGKMLQVTFSSKLDWALIQENQSLNSFYEVCFSWSCSVSFFNWDSLHARLNSEYKAWKYKKKKNKKIKTYRKWLVYFCFRCDNGWVCFCRKIFQDATGDFFF